MLSNEIEQRKESEPATSRGLGYFWPFGLALLVFTLDQYTKWLTETNLGPYGAGKETEILGGLVRFRYVQNTGASFSLLKDQGWIFTLIASMVCLGIIFWYSWRGTKYPWYQLCVGLLLAGAAGNLSDRLFKKGAVTDMINIPWIEIFKNFNVADISLNIGVSILVITYVIQAAANAKKPETNSEDSY